MHCGRGPPWPGGVLQAVLCPGQDGAGGREACQGGNGQPAAQWVSHEHALVEPRQGRQGRWRRGGRQAPYGVGNHKARVWFDPLWAQQQRHPCLPRGKWRRRQGQVHPCVAVPLLRRGQEIVQGGQLRMEVAAPIAEETQRR